MKILISNDDGIEAPGINTLHELLSEHADCRVVAPLGPQSGLLDPLWEHPFSMPFFSGFWVSPWPPKPHTAAMATHPLATR